MEREEALAKLVAYGVEKELIHPEDRVWAVNTLLDVLELSSCALPEVQAPAEGELPEILGVCDRVLVMRDGWITANIDRADATQEKIMSHSI